MILAFFVCLPPYICREDDAGRVSTVFIRFLRPPRAGRAHLSQQLELDPHREIDDLGQVERLVPAFGDDVEVVGAQFVIKRDMTQQTVVFQVIRETLPDVEMRPQARGEAVVAVAGVFVGFAHPIILARNQIEINSGREGLDGKPLAAPDAPRNVILPEREGRMRPVGIGPGQKTYQHVGLPTAFLSVVPTAAERHESHASGVLRLDMRGNPPLPPFVTPMLPEVEASVLSEPDVGERNERRVLSRRRRQPQTTGQYDDQPLKIPPVHSCIPPR